MTISRRWFLQLSGAAALGMLGLRAVAALDDRRVLRKHPGIGPIVEDPEGVCDLPAGFQYQIIARRGDKMADGLITPAMADGMAAFPLASGLTALVCNHENRTEQGHVGPWGDKYELFTDKHRSLIYDAGFGKTPAHGGTTTIVYDTRSHQKVRQFLSLGGTVRNCAGGATPWGSWLTCEETEAPAGDPYEKDHGWVFEVPATEQPVLHAARPIKAMGRFYHEAVCIDPRSGIVYLTEDKGDGLLYRFIPDKPGELVAGGRLQALVIANQPSLDLSNHKSQVVSVGQRLPIRWIDVEDVEAPKADLRRRGFKAGAARFSRGEGCVWAEDAAFIVCTDGGAAERGQIWRLTPDPERELQVGEAPAGMLELFAEPEDGAIVDMPDNCCAAPWGDLILAEDNGRSEKFLVGVTPKGDMYHLLRNAISRSELAGCTFSPDGSTLFVNIQGDGLTLAVWGPWPHLSA